MILNWQCTSPQDSSLNLTPARHLDWQITAQLRWAKEAVRRAVSKGGRNCSASSLHGLGMKLHHLADSLEHFSMFTLATGWAELEKVRPIDPFPTASAKLACKAAETRL